MRKTSVPKVEICRAGTGDIGMLVRMRIALLREVGNLRSNADAKVLVGAIRRYFSKALPVGQYVGFIARVEGQPVACGGLTFYTRPPFKGNASGKEAYLMGMYTVASWRGRGVGRAVLQGILAFAKARRVGRVWLHSEPGARSLYAREGFCSNDSYMELIW